MAGSAKLKTLQKSLRGRDQLQPQMYTHLKALHVSLRRNNETSMCPSSQHCLPNVNLSAKEMEHGVDHNPLLTEFNQLLHNFAAFEKDMRFFTTPPFPLTWQKSMRECNWRSLNSNAMILWGDTFSTYRSSDRSLEKARFHLKRCRESIWGFRSLMTEQKAAENQVDRQPSLQHSSCLENNRTFSRLVSSSSVLHTNAEWTAAPHHRRDKNEWPYMCWCVDNFNYLIHFILVKLSRNISLLDVRISLLPSFT